MTDIVPRTCTEIGEDGQVKKNADKSERTRLSFEEFRDTDAYVLLGPPGAGKTEVFKQEADCLKACYVTARDFITFDDRPEWHNTTLFIDGLDEKRAGSPDGRQALDGIRGKLDRLGGPRFRLSCREADWFGANDRESLKVVSLNETVTVLRLDPLTDEDVLKILRDKLKADDPEKFVREAHQKGLETLLTNPQSLKMLAKAVESVGGDWPETRLQTFDMACRTLLREHRQEHQIAKPDNVGISVLLDAAGRLCTIQLLTGCAGYTLSGTESDHEYPSLEQISGRDQKVLRHVLGTKLFESPSEGRATPVHRHVAEFLGGQYLAGLIETGLPVGRILALMTGDDGGVVSEMRGLSAWLTSHGKTDRMAIIERDPIGTVLYGDVRDFSIDEKRRLIHGLYRESQRNPWFFSSLEMMDSRFGDLATPDMEPVFREVLTSPLRDDAHQVLTMILIEALRHGSAIPELTDAVLGIVKDDSWKEGIRHRALDTILHHGKNDQQAGDKLKGLLADVYGGSVPDSDDELLGQLLCALYPSKLSASEILRYLRLPKRRDLLGTYKLFWNGYVVEDSTNAQCAELLDTLVERYKKLSAEIREDPQPDIPFSSLPSALLVRFLKTSQEEIDTDRIFNWLDVAALDFLDTDRDKISDWLDNHPETQKVITAMCIEHCYGIEQFDSFVTCVNRKRQRLFNATPPPDFGYWCLDQAILATDDNAAIWYIRKVADAVHWHEAGLTREIVERRLTHHPSLENAFENALRERLSRHEESKNRENEIKKKSEKKKSKERQEFQDLVKKHVVALRENRCPPELLNYLATAYFGEPIDIRVEGNSPKDRLHNLLGGDTGLTEDVRTALRDSVDRRDVPDDAEIIQLRANNQMSPLERPFLAGLEELSEPDKKPPLNERQIRQAIAFYYTSVSLRYYRGDKPHWYRWLLTRHPEVVSDVLIEFVRSELRNEEEHFPEAPKLAFSKEHQAVASLASLPLLELFPVRCTSRQLGLLNALLIAALFYCEKETFEKLIERKLSLPSMNIGQCVYWLAAGFFASPASYREKLQASVSGYEQRIRHLAEFLTAYRDQAAWARLFSRLGAQELELLIRLLGETYRPISYSSRVMSYDGTQAMTTDLVSGFINRLASLPSPDATTALESLSSDNSLRPWRFNVVNAASQQNITRREASFRHKDVDQVLQVLDKLRPANAADLAALTMDILSDMAKRIRDGNTSDWRQYWNMDSPSQPDTPKHEDLCRDALLSDLRLKLQPLSIDAQPEGRYADDKRADVRVTYGDFNVPVEIKKSTHRDLWRAVREQLIAKYTRDPGADGYGIYLVFSFGTEGCQMPPSGKRPTSAHELQERLLDTLSADEKFKIAICVIDVSKR